MLSKNQIQSKKDLFDLPYRKDQLEYWGPLNHSFSDSFLTMGNAFIFEYFNHLNNRFIKIIFSSFVEMVQNIAEYNEESFTGSLPQSFVRLYDGEEMVTIETANLILEKDLVAVRTIFEKNAEIPAEQLEADYKKLLLSGGSLGLIMLRKLKNSTFEYSLLKTKEGDNWLSLELKIYHGNT